MSTNTPPPPTPKSRFSAYTNALKAISKRTGTPLPSLILSFGIVHELTALIPLVGVFQASKALGVGEAIVHGAVAESSSSGSEESGAMRWGKAKLKEWVEEGDAWAERVGRRYGVFGYEKRKPGEVGGADDEKKFPSENRHRIAGDVANAVVAYGVTKALLPVRIGVSMYLAPGFARGVLDPARRAIIGVFRKPQP